MLPFLASTSYEPPSPPCPRCGGLLVPLAGHCRCQRCAFALCAECDAGPADENESLDADMSASQ